MRLNRQADLQQGETELRRSKLQKNSIVFKISMVITVLFATVICLLVGYNIYSFSAASRGVWEQQQRVLNIYTQKMGTLLGDATTMLDELALDNLGRTSTMPNKTAFQRYISSIDLAGVLSTRVDRNPRLTCLYFLYPEIDVLLMRYSVTLDWTQKFQLDDYLRAEHAWNNDALSGVWHVRELGGSFFLQQNYRIGEADMGVLIKAQELLMSEDSERSWKSVYFLTDMDGRIVATENAELFPVGESVSNDEAYHLEENMVLFTDALPEGGLRLSCAVPGSEVYAGFGRTQFYFLTIGTLFVFAMVCISRYLSRNIVDPLKELSRATQELERGNIDYRIQTDRAYAFEFSDLFSLFNHMTQEISALKIQNYEEALERKNAEVKYLQLQLHPHFYLNAITTISSLSMRGENEQIQSFIRALSTYLRYLFTDNQNATTVESEIRHAEDYIRLQQISHADTIFYYTSVDPRAAQVPLQKLLVQTFVENIFKHAFDGEASISIFIRASIVEEDGESYAQITVEDTGYGFPQELLDKMPMPDEKKHVGIYNICQTMKFTYGRTDLIRLSNNKQGGACVEIHVPLDAEGEWTNEASDRG